MPLDDILSLDALQKTLTLIQDRALQLRLVSRKIKMTLESNIFLKINIHINDAGVEGLATGLLQKWRGNVCLHCTRPWNRDSRWFQEVSDALLLGRLRPLGLLSLSVQGHNLLPLIKSLVRIGPLINQLEIAYLGNGAEIVAAATDIASLRQTLAMKISVEKNYPEESQPILWFHLLQASSVRINSLSVRSISLPLATTPCYPPCPTVTEFHLYSSSPLAVTMSWTLVI